MLATFPFFRQYFGKIIAVVELVKFHRTGTDNNGIVILGVNL
tara:strand:- start:1687 stop:1812 length:126 start_codon:yes stop_codon:yes gene_type:complete